MIRIVEAGSYILSTSAVGVAKLDVDGERLVRSADFAAEDAAEDAASEVPPPPSRTDWTRLVPPPVLTGHVSSLLPY